MKIEDIKVESIEKLDRIVPTGSSGTGYCEHVRILVNFDNHLSKTMMIPDWYTNLTDQVKDFKIEMEAMLTLGYYVIIDQEAIDMFCKIITEGHTILK